MDPFITQSDCRPNDIAVVVCGDDHDMKNIIEKQKQRIDDLETSLAEARKIIRDREDLLTHLQWKPKEDYYVIKNFQSTEKAKDELARRMKQLLEQMRVMESVLNERDSEIIGLRLNGASTPSPITPRSPTDSMHISFVDSPDGKARFVSPRRSPAKLPGWQRSPSVSPSSDGSRSRWWFFKGNSNSEVKIESTTEDSDPSSILPLVNSQRMVIV